MSESPPTKPTMFCRKCWYVLDGLSENRCPECGREFDPGNRRTHRIRSRNRWWVFVLLRSVALLLGLVLLVLTTMGAWLYRRHTIEQRAMAKITAAGGQYMARPIGPSWLTDWARRHDLPVLRRVEGVFFYGARVKNEDFKSLKGLTNLYRLHVKDPMGQQFTDAALVYLDALPNLQQLELTRSKITDAGLVDLKDLPLKGLFLSGTEVTDAELVHLTGLTNLTRLYLNGTQVTDAGLVHLKKLTKLQGLSLHDTRVTDAGLVHLKELNSLRFVAVPTQVTAVGIADLKRALPYVEVSQ